MPKKSATGKVVRKSAAEVPRPTKADLDRLRAGMEGDIDTSEIPERRKFRPLKRDFRQDGRLRPICFFLRNICRLAYFRNLTGVFRALFRTQLETYCQVGFQFVLSRQDVADAIVRHVEFQLPIGREIGHRRRMILTARRGGNAVEHA